MFCVLTPNFIIITCKCIMTKYRLATFTTGSSKDYETFETDSCPSSSPSSCHAGGARGVVVIAVGNGHGDTSSNPGRD